jgi:uncharacterized repeat protein (TIGR03803 family)
MMNMPRDANNIFGIPPRPINVAIALATLLTLLCVLAASASAQTFSLLRQFRSGPGGINPYAGVVLDARGNLYGTMYNDGALASGTVFRLSAAGKEKVLYNFAGIGGDGAFPYFGSLARDSSGTLYGTTYDGGIYSQFCLFSCGTVFKVDASGKETVLYRFTATGGDGQNPWQGVIRDPAGNLYGTTFTGGTTGSGTVFTVDPSGKETILYSFRGSTDGGFPYGGLVRDAKGNLYGTTSGGGSSFGGTVFTVDPSGVETVLYNFIGGADGGAPQAGLIRDSAGNLYGTTYVGGAAALGTVFKVNIQDQETVLYSFTGGADGANPAYGSLVRDRTGNLYGTTQTGGSSGFGIVFKIDTTGKETVLHSFSGSDGKIPYGTLALDKAGNLYGTTSAGGAYGGGVVFKIAP